MKKAILSLAIAMAIATNAFSQNTNPWPSTGNVGIGTASPGAPLEVVVSDANASSVSTALIVNKKTSGTAAVGIGAGIDFYAQHANGTSYIVANVSGIRTGVGTGSSNNGALAFKTFRSSTSGLTEAMRINRLGYVGIGETDPQYNLDVSNVNNTGAPPTIRIREVAATGISQLRLENDLGTVSNFFVYGSTASGTNWFDQARPNLTVLNGGATLAVGTFNANPLIFGTTNAERMRIASDGKVGIGITNPSEKLHVANGGIKISNTGSVGLKLFNVTDDTEKMHLYWRPADDVIEFNTGAGSSRQISLVTGGIEGIRVNASGNVAIGLGALTFPAGYKLAVNGAAIAASMKVKLSANWPDFVFLKDYKLPTLTEVKAYIDKNHRLPEMPSAEDVHANGLDLGEANRLLLKKVEELTLYLLEQQKQIDELSKKVLKLQNGSRK